MNKLQAMTLWELMRLENQTTEIIKRRKLDDDKDMEAFIASCILRGYVRAEIARRNPTERLP